MSKWLRAVIQHTHGQDLIEYALLASLISLAVLSAVLLAGRDVGGLTDGVLGRVAAALGAAAH